MSEQLPVDLEHAVWYCAHASLSRFSPDDDARKASDAIRAEHAKRVTLQHHAADLEQQIEDLRFAAEAGGRRIADLEAERDALRAKLDGIEAQEPVGVLKSDQHDGHIFTPSVDDDWSMLNQPLFTRPVTAQGVPDADGARFRWLCEDHSDRETREQCRSLIDRLSGMSYSAAVMSIDAAMAAEPEHKA